MKALVKKYAEEGLWLEDVPIPEIAGNEVLIKIHKTAICGTDVHIYNWDDWAQKTIQVPMVSGHEYAGEIVDVGANVTGTRLVLRHRSRRARQPEPSSCLGLFGAARADTFRLNDSPLYVKACGMCRVMQYAPCCGR